MADEVEIDKFLEECEQRLRCHYVRPECAGPLPDAARSTRYLFPTSLHGVGIVAPNSAIELLLVADISPKTFWNEAEEVFEDATYRMSISKKKIHPATATASSDEKATVLLVESSERVIVLEYCQMQVADVLDVNGRIYFDAATKHPLLTRARDIQQLHDTDDLKAATFRQNTIRCIQLAHHSGMLSGRLNLLTHSQLANAFAREQAEWAAEQVTASNMLVWLLNERFTTNKTMGPPLAANTTPSNSPTEGLQVFRDTHTLFALIQVNYWAPGARLPFTDAFFDVVATLQHDLQKDGRSGARAWPYHLTDPAAQDGAAFYLMGIWRSDHGTANTDELEREEFEKECATDRIYEITQDLLGYQYRVGKNGEENECYIQSTLISSDDDFFTSSKDFLQRHMAPVRGLSSSALNRIQGESTTQKALKDQEITDEAIVPPSSSFRTSKNILDQLRWDPKYAGARSYEVGYVDRFSDELIWLPIEDWVQTTEEEEFIPLHRIRQYRNTATKEVVWDRAMRLDKLK